MMIRKAVAVCLLACVMLVPAIADDSPAALAIEVLGKSTITATVAYERRMTDRFSVGGAVGINNITRVDFTVDEVTMTATDLAMPLSLYGVASPLGDRHRLIVPFGLAVFTEFSLHPDRRYIAGKFVPFVGAGYELRGRRLGFRAVAYLAYLGEPSEFLPAVMPWPGLSLIWSL
jgi:hypothetical protein